MRPALRRAGVLVASTVVVAAGCGGSSHHRGTSTPAPRIHIPAAITRDVWHPPALPGPPSAGTFCKGLVADYEHVQGNAIAATPGVKRQILSDFVAYTPKVVAVAPADIAPAAASFLGAEARVIGVLLRYDLDAAKAPRGSIGDILFDPTVRAAEPGVVSYAADTCHYDLGAAS